MTGRSENPLRRLVGEIHRRSLWQVLAIYVVASWVAFEVVQTLTEGLGLPGWLPGFAFVLLVIGLPIVLATAFVQEGGPTRITPPSLSELDEIFTEGEGAPEAPPSGVQAIFTWRNAIAGGVLAFALWGVVAAGWIAFDPGADGPSVGASPPDDAVFIAVLPLEHRSGLDSDRWFTEAVHDQLIGSLGRISGMRVSSRTAVSRYADAERSPSEIGRELGVDYLVEGSVQRGGGRLLIASGLVEAETGQQVWYRDFERAYTAGEMFDVQREIATTVANQVAVEVRPGELSASSLPATTSREAMERVFRADLLWDDADGASLREQIRLYREALSIDSSYVEAWAQLARARALLGAQERLPERLRLAKHALDHAQSISPRAPSVVAARGYVQYYVHREYEAANASLQEAGRLDPSDVQLRFTRAYLLRRLGRVRDAVSLAEETLKLEPRSISLLHALLDWHNYLGDMDESRNYLQRWRTLEPEDEGPIFHEAWLHLSEGNPSAALGVLEEQGRELITPFSRDDGAPTPLYFTGDLQGEFELWVNSNPSREHHSAYRLFRLGQLSALMGREARASAYGDSLLALAEPGLARAEALDLGAWQWPASWWKAQLARAYALLGRSEETHRWGERTLADFRPKNDALDRVRLARFLLDAYLLVDLREPALEMLEIVLSSPYGMTSALLATDPALRPILDEPDVQALLDEYE